jgi:hypothetical protein
MSETEKTDKKPGLLTRAKASMHNKLDGAMIKAGMQRKTRALTFHYISLLNEQLMAMVPITLLQVRVPVWPVTTLSL